MIICQEKLETLDFYLAHPNQEFFVFDLNHQAPGLIHEAEKRKYKFYIGNSTRRVKDNWIQTWTFGSGSPTTLKIALWNGVQLFDYTKFDNTSECPTLTEMQKVADIIDTKYRDEKHKLPMTGCNIINGMIDPAITRINVNTHNNDNAKDYSVFYSNAMRGGANAVLDKSLIDFETHIDFHQLYAYIMKSKTFPRGIPKLHDGFYQCKYGLYIIGGGIARVKPDGFPLLKSQLGTYMSGIDGEWFDMYKELGVISSVDYQLLLRNYEVKDLWITDTIEYSDKYEFKGEQFFGAMIDEIYGGRQKNTGSVKRFYKLMNEYIAGFFERSTKPSGWWRGLEPPQKDSKQTIKLTYKNPIVGIFITSYGRELLDGLLHKFPHDKVIGYDTDCVFFHGRPQEVPQDVLEMMGDNPGQVHYDGIYEKVEHTASKHYAGWDTESKQFFRKASGVSKSGKSIRWNRDKKIYEVFIKDEK